MTAKKNVYAALIEARKGFGPLKRKSKGYNYHYADLAQVLDLVDEELEKQGIWIECGPKHPLYQEGGVNCQIKAHHPASDTSTEEMLIFIPLPDKATPQDYGGALTYARRYLYLSLLGLAQEDDDAASVSKPKAQQKKAPPPKASNGQAPSKANNLDMPSDENNIGPWRTFATNTLGMERQLELWKASRAGTDDTNVKNQAFITQVKEEVENA